MLEKQVVIDKVEVLETGVIQVREAVRIVEDGKLLSQSYRRWCVAPGDSLDGQPERVVNAAKALWNQKTVDDYYTLTQRESPPKIKEYTLTEKTEVVKP